MSNGRPSRRQFTRAAAGLAAGVTAALAGCGGPEDDGDGGDDGGDDGAAPYREGEVDSGASADSEASRPNSAG